MSKTGAWALDHQEKEQEEYKIYRVTEKQVMEKTWIIKSKSPTDAWNSHLNTEPDNIEEGMRLDDGIVEVA